MKPSLEYLKKTELPRLNRTCCICQSEHRKFIEDAFAAGFGPSQIERELDRCGVLIGADPMYRHFKKGHHEQKTKS